MYRAEISSSAVRQSPFYSEAQSAFHPVGMGASAAQSKVSQYLIPSDQIGHCTDFPATKNHLCVRRDVGRSAWMGLSACAGISKRVLAKADRWQAPDKVGGSGKGKVRQVAQRNAGSEKSSFSGPEKVITACPEHGGTLVRNHVQTVSTAMPAGLVVDDLSNKYTDRMFATLQRIEAGSSVPVYTLS